MPNMSMPGVQSCEVGGQIGSDAGAQREGRVAVDHPPHYNSHPSGVECIQITEWFGFNIGNAVKYCWRAGLKGDAIEDLEKAVWYINREIQRLQGGAS